MTTTQQYDFLNRLATCTANPGASVIANGSAADHRRGEYFQELVNVSNSSAAVWQGVSVIAAHGGTSTTHSGNAPVNGYLWGLDLSGQTGSAPNGAGGVGGLIAIKTASNGTHFCAFDGNGNVAALVDGSNGTVSANYEYGPFGENIRVSGAVAALNPLRFSTKYCDAETDLYYYGYRFYNPELGRFLNRDPIAEKGGLNLYGFVGNDPENYIDPLGTDFIAVAGRPVRLPLGSGRIFNLNHYSIEYWHSCNPGPQAEISKASWRRKHLWSSSFSKGVELLADSGWRVGKVVSTGPIPVVIVSVSISKIVFGNQDGTTFVAVFDGEPLDVKRVWEKIEQLSKSYKYAEQADAIGALTGNFQNWPNSKYGFPWDLPFNNSNTFVRNVIESAHLTMRELGGDYPGNNSPVDVENIGSPPKHLKRHNRI